MNKPDEQAIPETTLVAVRRHALECAAEVQQMDSAFQKQFAEADWQTGLALVERYVTERFSLLADHLLFTSDSPDEFTTNPLYEQYLNRLEEKSLTFLRMVLKPMRSDLRDDILSRTGVKLSACKLQCSANSKRVRLASHAAPNPARSEDSLKCGQESLERARNTRASLELSGDRMDDFLEQLHRENAEAFALRQKIHADIHEMFMNTAGHAVKKRHNSDGNQVSATEPSGGKTLRTEARPVECAEGTSGSEIGKRAEIDAFILRLALAGHKVTRKDLWTVAGYKHPSEFERFQRGDSRTTRSATAALTRVLNLTPLDFIQLLEKKRVSK